MSKAEFVTMSGYQAEEYFQELKSRTVFKKVGHAWFTPKRLKWLVYCENCGLVFSHNKATDKAIKSGCRQAFTKERTA